MYGPGKYDDLCTEVRLRTLAQAVIVIVFNGIEGSGFSCQADASIVLDLPKVLERVAADMRRDHQGHQQ